MVPRHAGHRARSGARSGRAAARSRSCAAAGGSAAAPVMITDADIKGLSGPKAEDKAKGDPGGTITGTVADIPVGDAKKGLTHWRRRQPGRSEHDRDQLRVDAGRRLPRHVHAGRLRHRRDRPVPRQERQSHHDDELHGVRRRHARLLADWLCDPGRRRRRGGQPGRHGAAQRRVRHAPVRQGLGASSA